MAKFLKLHGLTWVGLLIFALPSCSHLQRQGQQSEVDTIQVADQIDPQKVKESSKAARKVPALGGEIPLEINPKVQKWITYFQGRGRRHMDRYLARSTRYLPIMKEILREKGLPEDLVYIALIESGFNSQAHSHAAAVGYWQFIRGTGKRYGLKISTFIDERRDPLLSTEAAAEYFKALYNLFGDWYLAMASYNTGENRVKRAVMRHGTRDFWRLTRRRRSLPRETRNYIPKFIAAAIIAKNPDQYGFSAVDYQPLFDYEIIKVGNSISLRKFARHLGYSYKEIKRLNPKFRADFAPVYRGKHLTIRVPRGMVSKAVAAAAKSYSSQPKFIPRDYIVHRVRRGDNLSMLAQKYRTRVSSIRRANRLGRRSMIRIGQRLKIPTRSTYIVKNSPAKKRVIRYSQSTGKYYIHKVRRGENLSVIAKRYGTSVRQLRRLNNLRRRSILRIGMRLKVKEKETKQNNTGTKFYPQRKTIVHKVKRGENLYLIAKKYKSNIHRIRKANKLKNRSLLKVGQKLKVPVGKVYVVRRGDTLIEIAQKYKTSVSRIASVNALNNRSVIHAGTQLVIPE